MLTRRAYILTKLMCNFNSQVVQYIKPNATGTILTVRNKTQLHKPATELEIDPETGKPKKKKTTPTPKITLLSSDSNDISVTTLEEAQRIAKRRDLKLVKLLDLDTKSERPVFKLMSGAEYFAEDLKQREKRKLDKQNTQLKGEKVLILSQKIADHDLQVNLNKITKWLKKRYEVRIVINTTGDNKSRMDELYSIIEKNMTGVGRIVQKRQKGLDVKFQILPPKEPKNEGGDQVENNGSEKNQKNTS